MRAESVAERALDGGPGGPGLTLHLPAAVSFPAGRWIPPGVICPLTGWTDQCLPHCISPSPRGPPEVSRDLILSAHGKDCVG